MSTTALAITPTKEQVQYKWREDLEREGLSILNAARKSTQPRVVITTLLDAVKESYAPREATFVSEFVYDGAETLGFL